MTDVIDVVLDGQLCPNGWAAPRREYLVAGFDNQKHIFAFDAVKVTATGNTSVWRAKCARCGTEVPPYMEDMKLHAMLHLAVDLATKA